MELHSHNEAGKWIKTIKIQHNAPIITQEMLWGIIGELILFFKG